MSIRTVKQVLLVGLLSLIVGVLYGGEARGILVIMPFAGADRPTCITFSEISWKTAASGSVTDTFGSTSTFSNDLVVNILYLDTDYLRTIASDESQSPFRTEIKPKEIDVGTTRQNLSSETDADSLNLAHKQIQNLLHQYPSIAEALGSVDKEVLAEIERYQNGDRKEGGKWYSANEYSKHLAEVASHAGLVITLLSGVKYQNVELGEATKAGISIKHSNGVATIRIEELPDLSQLQGWSDANLDKLDALKHQVEELNNIKPPPEEVANEVIPIIVLKLNSVPSPSLGKP